MWKETYLNFISELTEVFKYRSLDPKYSEEVRGYFKRNIPNFLDINGNAESNLLTSNGTLICKGYERIVVGDYGAYIEFNEGQSNDGEFIIQPGQEYRVNDEKYSKSVKYYWFTTKDNSDIKIYYQQRPVTYADYKPNMFYVCISEVKNN